VEPTAARAERQLCANRPRVDAQRGTHGAARAASDARTASPPTCEVRPTRGAALLFFSQHPNGTVDTGSAHASCPMRRGGGGGGGGGGEDREGGGGSGEGSATKWIAQQWILDRPLDEAPTEGGKLDGGRAIDRGADFDPRVLDDV